MNFKERAELSLSQKDKEVAIDVGGGKGEYFSRLAKENPDKKFVILDPVAVPLKEKIDNLQVLRWKIDTDSTLPFKSESIDEAHINFVMGEIRDKEGAATTITTEVRKYSRIILGLKETLKKGGVVCITDVRSNIFIIKTILEKHGFTIIKQPEKLQDPDKTAWARFFVDGYKASGLKENESFALPMEMEARLNRKEQ